MAEARERFEELADGEITTFHAPLRQGERRELECLANEYEMWFACSEAIGFVVGRVNDFAAWAERELDRLRPGERFDFVLLSPSQRRVIGMIAERLKLWMYPGAAALSSSHRAVDVMVFHLKEFADRVEESLKNLEPGERCVVEDAKTSEEHRIVRLLSQDCALWPAEVDGHMEVFHLAAFARKMRTECLAIGLGKCCEYPKQTENERAVLNIIANVFNLAVVPLGERVLVGNLGGFQETALARLNKLPQGQQTMFKELNKVQLHVVNTLCKKLGITVDVSMRNDGNWDCLIIKPSDGNKFGATWTERRVSQLFDTFATGQSLEDAKVILRKTDLKGLLSSVLNAAEKDKKKLKNGVRALESLYDNTMELQIDMGVRSGKGLTLEYFQVFMHQVASQVIGWSLGSLLMATLPNAGNEEDAGE
eukprot:gnl/MRDRNA2_/MRDRNA2_114023_c0_seq1.p1 gnl/MRDRNA2_/MRDRNA2_114023_c0~~gnl/MRDRNA2_/MRDRNA2_114023_c0_seq1.p1  ORF type:complete len:422 (+),score=89.99 gnl/MRDRNA2_/MRDRNA2_114023_c0_seq1:481-1746(+)